MQQPKIAKKKKVSEIIVDELIEGIRTGELKPGERLPNERKLSEQMGVSRMSLREAIQVLHQVGILESRQGNGTFVCDYTAEKVGKALYWYSLLGASPLLDLVAARRVMEAEAARLAAVNATPEDLERIRAAMLEREQLLQGESKDNGPDSRRLDAGARFHRAIAIASHNAVFVQFLNAIDASRRVHQDTAARYQLLATAVTRTHRELYEAIAAHDPDRAEILMRGHLDQVEEAVSRQMELRSETEGS
jgi:DNA-binding FadR family transcriptional regulator